MKKVSFALAVVFCVVVGGMAAVRHYRKPLGVVSAESKTDATGEPHCFMNSGEVDCKTGVYLIRGPLAAEPIKADWRKVKSDTYTARWLYVDSKDEIIGEARKTTWDPTWEAFVGQGFCGSGEFMTESAAKACVEQKAR